MNIAISDFNSPDLVINKLGEATMISALKVNRKGKIQIIYR